MTSLYHKNLDFKFSPINSVIASTIFDWCVYPIMKKAKVPYALMHTTNLYPTPSNLVCLGGMQELMKEFPDVPIGLPDHTLMR